MVRRMIPVAWIAGLIAMVFHCSNSAASELAKATTPSRTALDFSLIEQAADDDTVGYYSLRLSDLSKIQGIDEALTKVATQITDLFGFKFSMPISEIEVISGQLTARVIPSADDPKKKSFLMMMTFSVIRFKHDIEWSRDLEKMFGETRCLKAHGQTYYRLEVPKGMRSICGQDTFYALPVDSRAVMFTFSDKAIERIGKTRIQESPKPRWHAHAQPLEGGTLMMVFPDVSKLKKPFADLPDGSELSPEEKNKRDAFFAMLAKMESLVLGMSASTQFDMQLSIKARQADSKEIAAYLNRMVKEINESPAASDDEVQKDAAERFGRELLNNLRIKETADGVRITTTSKEGAAAVWKEILLALSKFLGNGKA